MNREDINSMERAAEENVDLMRNAREDVAERKGMQENSGSEELDMEVFQQYIESHSDINAYEYLVRGAKLRCRCGSHIRMLNLPECHGVYIGENPMVHEYDCIQGVDKKGNISWFGICNAERCQELPGEDVCYQLTEENSANGEVGEAGPGKKCQPVIVGVWQDVYDRTKIVDYWDGDMMNEEEACSLTTGSFLVCNYGGIIEPVTSGQEYEMTEEDLGNNKDSNGNDINSELWEEILDRRENGTTGCGDSSCMLAHELYKDKENVDHSNVHGIIYYTVVFQYEDGRIISEQQVKKGESAEEPTTEEREGYFFAGWNAEYNNVQSNLHLTAQYVDEITYIKGQLDKITDISTWMNKAYQEEKLQTAKDLIINILNDKELRDLGADLPWICGVLANMCKEGIPGLLEGNTNSLYMSNANSHGYSKYKEKNGEILINTETIPPLAEIANCTVHAERTCGFGFGMFQWTFGRTGAVLLKYEEWYSSHLEDLTYQERFDVEWAYFKDEMRTDYYKNSLTKYVNRKTGNAEEDAKIAAEIFRIWYEGNSSGIDEAKEFATSWLQELETVNVGDKL